MPTSTSTCVGACWTPAAPRPTTRPRPRKPCSAACRACWPGRTRHCGRSCSRSWNRSFGPTRQRCPACVHSSGRVCARSGSTGGPRCARRSSAWHRISPRACRRRCAVCRARSRTRAKRTCATGSRRAATSAGPTGTPAWRISPWSRAPACACCTATARAWTWKPSNRCCASTFTWCRARRPAFSARSSFPIRRVWRHPRTARPLATPCPCRHASICVRPMKTTFGCCACSPCYRPAGANSARMRFAPAPSGRGFLPRCSGSWTRRRHRLTACPPSSRASRIPRRSKRCSSWPRRAASPTDCAARIPDCAATLTGWMA